MSPHRLAQFTDGIFAISATLLVLNFAVPAIGDGGNGALTQHLLEQWPRLLAFLLSFGVVVNYWRLHSAMFVGIQEIDHRTIMFNVILLVMAAFVPYATNVAGTYPTLPAAAVLYSVTLLIAGAAGLGMSRHLMRSDAYHGVVPPGALEASKRIKLAVYFRIVGLAFAFFFPIISYAIYWVVIVYYLMLGQVDVYAAMEKPAP